MCDSLRCLSRSRPELHQIGIGSGPAGNSLVTEPDELNVISVGNVEAVVSVLSSKEVKGVVQNQLLGRNRALAVDGDGSSSSIRFGNVVGRATELGSYSLVRFWNVGGIGFCGLAARNLVAVSGIGDASVTTGSSRSGIHNYHNP